MRKGDTSKKWDQHLVERYVYFRAIMKPDWGLIPDFSDVSCKSKPYLSYSPQKRRFLIRLPCWKFCILSRSDLDEGCVSIYTGPWNLEVHRTLLGPNATNGRGRAHAGRWTYAQLVPEFEYRPVILVWLYRNSAKNSSIEFDTDMITRLT